MKSYDECKINELKIHAYNMRKLVLDAAFSCGKSVHIGGAFSMIDALSVLYGCIMNGSGGPSYENKDKFILSKGHAVVGLYAALCEYGILAKEEMNTFMQNGSDLCGHPVMNERIGIESSSGSLGQGISMAVGLALAAKRKKYGYHTYVICGNGECNEGSVWEACMSAVNYKLDNLTVFLDNNHMQSDGKSEDILDVADKYEDLFKALGFNVLVINGNSIEELYDAFSTPIVPEHPRMIIGNTVKGFGVDFMENNNDWHHNRLVKDKYEQAIKVLIND